MAKDLPNPEPYEIVQMMAAQAVLMDHHEQLDTEYKQKIKEFGEEYGVDTGHVQIGMDADDSDDSHVSL
jgi:hypothetical protein